MHTETSDESLPAPDARDTVRVWSGYSLRERDRRWAVVREKARQANLDCVLVPAGNGYDGRYLTQFLTSAIVLPADGRPPIVITDREPGNAWVTEPRHAQQGWGGPMAEALIEAGMERARVGVAGLRGNGLVTYARIPNGVVNYASFAEVQRRLPNATFVDANDVLGLARWVKGPEELECARRAVAIAEAGLDELVEMARPGVDGDELFAAIMARMLALGAEDWLIALSMDPVGKGHSRRIVSTPVAKRLESNDYISAETEAGWGAQATQEEQHLVLGPIPERFKAAEDLLREVFEATAAMLKPGTTVGELIDATNTFATRHGGWDGLATRSMLKGGGYGEDGPRISPMTVSSADLAVGLRELRFEDGAVVVWKPDVYAEDMGMALSWGGSMVITEHGGQLLGKRPLGLVSIS